MWGGEGHDRGQGAKEGCSEEGASQQHPRVRRTFPKQQTAGAESWRHERACHVLEVINGLMGPEHRLYMRQCPGDTGEVHRLLSREGLSTSPKEFFEKEIPVNAHDQLVRVKARRCIQCIVGLNLAACPCGFHSVWLCVSHEARVRWLGSEGLCLSFCSRCMSFPLMP